MADILDLLRQIGGGDLDDGNPNSDPKPSPSAKFDENSGNYMEERDIFHEGRIIATLDFNKKTGAWFLDTKELVKLSRVPNVVSLILAEEAK